VRDYLSVEEEDEGLGNWGQGRNNPEGILLPVERNLIPEFNGSQNTNYG